MSNPKTSNKHWEFALNNAFARLQTLIWSFDELREKSGFVVVNTQKPDEISTILDGFLDEVQWLNSGEVRLLERLKESLSQNVTPAFESGRNAAAEIWSSAPPNGQRNLLKTADEVILAEAENHLQKLDIGELSDQAWFIEGFFLQWQDETLNFIAKHGADN
jgi:hypothetical protein